MLAYLWLTQELNGVAGGYRARYLFLRREALYLLSYGNKVFNARRFRPIHIAALGFLYAMDSLWALT